MIKCFKDRVLNRETPPIYKDWNNFPDIDGLDPYQLVAKLSISWDIVRSKGEDGAANILGLEWGRSITEYPFLTKDLENIEEAQRRYKLIHDYNPNTMLGVEIRWDVLKDYELPSEHQWWMRDEAGNRILYRQTSLARYKTNVGDPQYVDWIGERCKALFETGVVDFVFFDHIKHFRDHDGDPIPFFKALREKLEPEAIILGNVHYEMVPELEKYIDNWGEEEKGTHGLLEPILFWENSQSKRRRFNCWEFVGDKDDLQAMRYYTTLVMTNTNASLRYIDHRGATKPSPWYDFWDVRIGKAKEKMRIQNFCFTREYVNGTTVCNNSDIPQRMMFFETRIRVSTGEQGKTFNIPSKDGDIFLYAK